jgi:hypothetical protein
MAKLNREHREWFAANPETHWRRVDGSRSPDQERRHAGNPEWFEVKGGTCAMCTWGMKPDPEPRAAAPAPATEATGRPVGRPVTAPAHERVDRAVYDEFDREANAAKALTKIRRRPGEKAIIPGVARLREYILADLKAMGYSVRFTEGEVPQHRPIPEGDIIYGEQNPRTKSITIRTTWGDGSPRPLRDVVQTLSHEYAHVLLPGESDEGQIDTMAEKIMRGYGRPAPPRRRASR